MGLPTSPINKMFVDELEQETESTIKTLSAIPGDKLSWKPHEKSFSLGTLAMHIATALQGTAEMLASDSLAMEDMKMDTPDPQSVDEIVSTCQNGFKVAKQIVSSMSDEELKKQWTMTMNGDVIYSNTKAGIVRNFTLNHLYHHRGQLQVYLRLLDVALPSVYGPTADDNPFAEM
jgi:uncharacterized damage-inducible protein DinB